MSEHSSNPSELSLTERLLLDPAMQVSVRAAFTTIDGAYTKAKAEAREVTSLASFALLDRGAIVEVARAKAADGDPFMEPEDFLVHYTDLTNPGEIAAAQRQVTEVVTLRDGDIVLTVEDPGSPHNPALSMIDLPGYASRARGSGVSYTPMTEESSLGWTSERTENLRELRERLGISELGQTLQA